MERKIDWVKFVLSCFWFGFIVSTLIVLLAIFAPDTFSQSRFVSGIPINLPERIAYPTIGVSGLPPCNSRNSGKTYLFNSSLYGSATCNGTGTWNHYMWGNIPAVPPNLAALTPFNSATEVVAVIDGSLQIFVPAATAANIRGLDFPYPAGSVEIIVGLWSDIRAADFHNTGYYIRDSSAGPLIKTFGWFNNTLAGVGNQQIIVTTANNAQRGGGTVENFNPIAGYSSGLIWLRYTDDTVTRTFSTGSWGPLTGNTTNSWHIVQSEASGTFVTPTRFGIYVESQNVTCPVTTLFFHCSVNGQPCG